MHMQVDEEAQQVIRRRGTMSTCMYDRGLLLRPMSTSRLI